MRHRVQSGRHEVDQASVPVARDEDRVHTSREDGRLHLRDRPIGRSGTTDGSLKPESDAENHYVIGVGDMPTRAEDNTGGCPLEGDHLRDGRVDAKLYDRATRDFVELLTQVPLDITGRTGPPIH